MIAHSSLSSILEYNTYLIHFALSLPTGNSNFHCATLRDSTIIRKMHTSRLSLMFEEMQTKQSTQKEDSN